MADPPLVFEIWILELEDAGWLTCADQLTSMEEGGAGQTNVVSRGSGGHDARTSTS